MKTWEATLNIADIFHNDSLDLEEKAKNIRNRLTPIGEQVDPGSDELACLLDELVECGVERSVPQFDMVWNEIYDWADDNRVWIVTR